METTIYVAPKNLRKNQENCAFFLLSFFFPRYIVYQFDLKENKDKQSQKLVKHLTKILKRNGCNN